MTLAPVASLGTLTPTRLLTVGGLDVLKDPDAVAGSKFGVPLDSIDVLEAGPGGVSSMRFSIDDPAKAVTMARGQWVWYGDLTASRTVFRGLVQTWGYRPYGLGRTIDVRCAGVDAWLDWTSVPSLTIPVNTFIGTAVQMIVAAAIGIGIPVSAFAASNPGGTNGNAGGPVGTLHNISNGAWTADTVILAGQTVREAIRLVLAVTVPSFAGGTGGLGDRPSVGYATVDMDLKVRLYNSTPTDYADLTVVDAGGSALVASTPLYEVDATSQLAGVYVTGGNAAGTGLVSAGDGIPGPIAALSDPSILTSADRDQAGAAYLQAHSETIRAPITLEDTTWSTNVHPGASVVLTDAQLGLAGVSLRIASIRKRFAPLTETWTLQLGGAAPSAMRQIRRLTAAVRP